MTRSTLRSSSRTVGGRAVTVDDLGLVAAGFTQLRLVTVKVVTYLLVAVAQV